LIFEPLDLTAPISVLANALPVGWHRAGRAYC
jgi:hypothetical protein